MAFYSARWHKPRALAAAAAIGAVGHVLIVLPHFLTTYRTAFTGETVVCDASNPQTTCADTAFQAGSYTLLVLGQLVMGAASVPLFTTCIAYMDEIVDKAHVGTYLGVFYAFSSLGPAAGFVMGGTFLDSWHDVPNDPPSPDLEPDDVGAWVGAWWLGFVITAISMLMVAVPLALFPRHFANTEAVRLAKQASAQHLAQSSGSTSAATASLWHTTKRLARNKVVVLLSLAVALYVVLRAWLSSGMVLFALVTHVFGA